MGRVEGGFGPRRGTLALRRRGVAASRPPALGMVVFCIEKAIPKRRWRRPPGARLQNLTDFGRSPLVYACLPKPMGMQSGAWKTRSSCAWTWHPEVVRVGPQRGYSGPRNQVLISCIFFSPLSQNLRVSFYWTVFLDSRRLTSRGLPVVALPLRSLVCGVSRYGALGRVVAE